MMISKTILLPRTGQARIRFWISSCLRKIRFKTEKKAKEKAKEKGKEFGLKQTVYYCHNCCGYHLTTKDNSNERDP